MSRSSQALLSRICKILGNWAVACAGLPGTYRRLPRRRGSLLAESEARGYKITKSPSTRELVRRM